MTLIRACRSSASRSCRWLLTKILLDLDDFPTPGYEQAAWVLLGAS